MAGRIMMQCAKGRESGDAFDHERIQFPSPIGGYLDMMQLPERQGRPCRSGNLQCYHVQIIVVLAVALIYNIHSPFLEMRLQLLGIGEEDGNFP